LQFLHTFIGILFDGKPGQWRIDARYYDLLRTQTGKSIASGEAINAGDQVSMGMVIPELGSDGRHCPYPRCGAVLTEITEQRNDGQTWYLRKIQITNLRPTNAELSPECLRWFEVVELDSMTISSGVSQELSVQSSGQQLSGNSPMEGKWGNYRSKDEVELYRQIYAQSWRNPVFDWIPAYRLDSEDLRAYLQGRFGDHDFKIRVRILVPFFFDCITPSHVLLTNSCS
jgi:hypothetical protein